MKQIPKTLIESPHAAEPGSQRNFSHGHLRLVNQMLRKKHTPRLRHRDGRCSKMLYEQSPELTLAYA
jgi:hypothetical protein